MENILSGLNKTAVASSRVTTGQVVAFTVGRVLTPLHFLNWEAA
jgi:hypothetical protein